jgi:hypothetical protein
MTRPLVVLGLGLLGAAGVVGLLCGPAYGYAGVAAVGLCLPPALATVWWTGRLARRTRFAGLIGMAVGTAARTTVALGGGVALFWSVPEFRERAYGFWGWVLGVYLTTLVTETVVLSRFFWASTPVGKGTAA